MSSLFFKNYDLICNGVHQLGSLQTTKSYHRDSILKETLGETTFSSKGFFKDATEGQADQGSHEILIDPGTSLSGLCSLVLE